jgi:hypothetical protein
MSEKDVSLRISSLNQQGMDRWSNKKNTTDTGELGLGKTRPVTGCILMQFKNFELLSRHWVTEYIFGC